MQIPSKMFTKIYVKILVNTMMIEFFFLRKQKQVQVLQWTQAGGCNCNFFSQPPFFSTKSQHFTLKQTHFLTLKLKGIFWDAGARRYFLTYINNVKVGEQVGKYIFT